MSRSRRAVGRPLSQGGCHDRAAPDARAFVLVAVLVVLAIAFAVVAGMVMLARGDAAIAVTHERAAQSRSLGWSGVQALGVVLDRQRDRILAGESPRVDRQVVIYETPSTLGLVRLLPIGEANDGGDELLRAEGGRLDLNRVDAAALVATGLVDASQAGAIVAARGALGGRFLSEAELFGIEELSPELLVGSLEALAWAADAGRRGDEQGPEASGGRSASPTAATEMSAGVRASAGGVLDVVTVYSVESMLRRDGSPRVSLAGGWSDALGEQASRDFGPEFATALEALMKAGAPTGDGVLVKALRQRSVPASAWGEILDGYTAEPGTVIAAVPGGVPSTGPSTGSDDATELDDEDASSSAPAGGANWIAGRVDLNTAPYEAILAVPSLTPQQAAEIVRLRDDLSAEERWTPTWPVLRGIVTEEQFETLVDHVTTRCFLWRARLAAGEAPADDPDAPLSNAVVWEVVIDLTTPTWRIAFLRDATLLPLAAALLSAAPEDEAREDAVERAAASGATASTSVDGAAETSASGAEAPPEESVPEPDAPPEETMTEPEAPSVAEPPKPFGAPEGASKSTPKPKQAPSAPRGPTPVGRWRT